MTASSRVRGLALLLLGLAACAPLPTAPPPRPLSARARLDWRGAPPPAAERAELIEALDLGEAVYLGAFGGSPPVVRAVVFERSSSLPWGDLPHPPGSRLRGTYQRGVLRLPWRCRYPLRSLVHELHHARHGDGEHARADWPAVDALGWAWALEAWGWGWL